MLTVLKTSVMQNFEVLSGTYGILRICISGNCVQVCITKVGVCVFVTYDFVSVSVQNETF